MTRIWERIVRAFGGGRAGGSTRIPPERVKTLLRSLQETLERELGCAEADGLMDSFAEALRAGATPESLDADFRHHLAMCADCREDFEALLRVLRADPVSPA